MAEVYYAYMVQYGEDKALVLATNPNNGMPAPMIYSDKEFQVRHSEIAVQMQNLSNVSKMPFQLVKFSNVEVVDAIIPESMATN